MADEGSRDQTPPRGGEKPNWIARGVGAVQRQLEKRRAEKKQQSPADRAARSTARATWFIALLTVATISVGYSQFVIYKRQLDEMRATREGGDKSFAAQLAVMQAQATAMQGQLNQMTVDQRPWLLSHDLTVEAIDVVPDIPMIMIGADHKITNFGQSPAMDVFINTGLFINGIDIVNVSAIRNLCARRPFGSEMFFFYRDIMAPGKTEEIIGFPVLNGVYTRNIQSLRDEGVSKVNADFVLGVCITYRFLGSDTLHETGFAIRARIPRVRIVNRVVELEQVQIDKREKERIELQNLMLTSIPDLSFAD